MYSMAGGNNLVNNLNDISWLPVFLAEAAGYSMATIFCSFHMSPIHVMLGPWSSFSQPHCLFKKLKDIGAVGTIFLGKKSSTTSR